MTLKISRHVFGCRQGYRTLSGSADVTSAEREQLETFSFGQTNAAEYLDTLEINPAYWCRGLTSGRWAVTRVLKGTPDEKGRSTLLFVSALFDTVDWVRTLGADATPLLSQADLWAWDGQAALPPVKVRVGKLEAPRPDDAQRARVLSMLALVETRYEAVETTVAASELGFSPDDVRVFATLLPRDCKGTFSYAVRSLSDGLPVRLNCLARNASRGNAMRKITRWAPHVAYDEPTYTAALTFFWKPGQPPPWGFVANCRSFGQATWEGDAVRAVANRLPPDSLPAADGPQTPTRKAPWRNGNVVLAVALSLLVIATASFIWRQKSLRNQRESVREDVQKFVADVKKLVEEPPVPTATAEDHDECIKLMERADELDAEMSRLELPEADGGFVAARDELKGWLNGYKKQNRDRRDINNKVQEFTAFANSNGLAGLSANRPYPSPQKLSAVKRWRKDLELALNRVAELSEHDKGAVAEAQGRIDTWEQTVEKIVQRCDAELEELRDFYDDPRPGKLGNELLAEAGRRRTSLEGLQVRMKHMPAELGTDRTQSLTGELKYVRESAAAREEVLDRLTAEFRRHYGEAERLIRDHGLDIPNPRPDPSAVMEHWAPAKRALQRCEAALAIWPDKPECSKHAVMIDLWIDKAAQAAHQQFKSAVDYACQEWETRRKAATTRPADSEKLDPGGLLGFINAELDNYKKRQPAIDHHDPSQQVYQRALDLQAELKSVSGRSADD